MSLQPCFEGHCLGQKPHGETSLTLGRELSPAPGAALTHRRSRLVLGLGIHTHTCTPHRSPPCVSHGAQGNEERQSAEAKERDRSCAHTWVRDLARALLLQDSNLVTDYS